RRTWRANRILYLTVCLMLCVGLSAASRAGVLPPIEGAIPAPLNAIAGVLNPVALSLAHAAPDIAQIPTLRQRNADPAEALAQFQSELVELREISSDYQRLAGLLDYTTRAQNQQFVAADVVGVDQSSFLRTITINRGARDGITIGMPVVTGQGLVGRV